MSENAILSHMSSDTGIIQDIIQQELDALFDDILISSEIGVLKDDKAPPSTIPFFDPLPTAKGLAYKDAILLDDSPDISGKYHSLGLIESSLIRHKASYKLWKDWWVAMGRVNVCLIEFDSVGLQSRVRNS